MLYTVWQNWAIYWTLHNFSKPLATINLPKSSTVLGIFVKVSKSIIFLMKSFLGNFNRHLVIFFWSHWLDTTFDCDGYAMKIKNPSDLQLRRTLTISAILLLQLFLLYSLGIRKFPVVHRSCKSLWCISNIFVWHTVFVFFTLKAYLLWIKSSGADEQKLVKIIQTLRLQWMHLALNLISSFGLLKVFPLKSRGHHRHLHHQLQLSRWLHHAVHIGPRDIRSQSKYRNLWQKSRS